MGFVRGEDRQQSSLFSLALDELVPADHVCRVIEAFVMRLPLLEMGFAKPVPKATGRPAYDPGDLLKLYLYGYLHQLRSSRRLERECQRNVEAIWLLNRLAPDHKTIAQFRREHGDAIKRAGAWFVRFCQEVGVVRGEWVAIDGSKFQAVASPKAVLHRKALLEEQARIEARIATYLVELDAGDAASPVEPTTEPQAIARALDTLRERKLLVEELTRAVPYPPDGERDRRAPHARSWPRLQRAERGRWCAWIDCGA